MAPETIVGQLRPTITDARVHEDTNLKKMSFAGSWEGRFGSEEYEAVMEQRKDVVITVDWEDGRSDVLSGAEIFKLIFDSHTPWMLSANGTIFTTEYEDVVRKIANLDRRKYVVIKSTVTPGTTERLVEYRDWETDRKSVV